MRWTAVRPGGSTRRVHQKYEMDGVFLAGAKQDRWTPESLEVNPVLYCRYQAKNVNDNDNFVMDEIRLAA